ncbi:MAG: hypothetical protein ABIG20_04320 [archaeon]
MSRRGKVDIKKRLQEPAESFTNLDMVFLDRKTRNSGYILGIIKTKVVK